VGNILLHIDACHAKVGTGPTSAVMAFQCNVEVTVVDINPERIAAWNSMSLPIYEPGLDALVFVARDGLPVPHAYSSGAVEGQGTEHEIHRPNLFFSTNVDKAIQEADLIFVCVNTPAKSHGIGKGAGADLSFVEAATRNIARVATSSKIVVEKSTVPCRTADSIRQIVSENCPDRLRPADWGQLSANARDGIQFDVRLTPASLHRPN
jgi:UDPglucose 6-dehydrogenase